MAGKNVRSPCRAPPNAAAYIPFIGWAAQELSRPLTAVLARRALFAGVRRAAFQK
jgi:hypothetical protein